jgi:abhydrolase domain-containing protein 12
MMLILLPDVQHLAMYLNIVNFPFGVDWKSSGERFGFRTGSLRSVYIDTPDNMILGAWHIIPRKQSPLEGPYVGQDANDSGDALLASAERVYLYFHGNAGNRATGHRSSFYKVPGYNCSS